MIGVNLNDDDVRQLERRNEPQTGPYENDQFDTDHEQ
jgi:hypothetical protein